MLVLALKHFTYTDTNGNNLIAHKGDQIDLSDVSASLLAKRGYCQSSVQSKAIKAPRNKMIDTKSVMNKAANE